MGQTVLNSAQCHLISLYDYKGGDGEAARLGEYRAGTILSQVSQV